MSEHSEHQVNKTYREINDKIARGEAVVVTAEEIIGIAEKKGWWRLPDRSTW